MKHLLITIIASLLMGASFLSGMTLEDTQGQKLEATDVRLDGQSVSFKRADTGQEFTVPLSTLSERTKKAIGVILLEDTQGQTLEARDIHINGESISFTRVDTGLKFTVPSESLSKSTLDTITETVVEKALHKAANVQMSEDSVSFTHEKTGLKFTIPLNTLSGDTRDRMAKIQSEELEENLRAVIPVSGSTKGYKPSSDLRVLDVTQNEIIYEIPERTEIKEGDSYDKFPHSRANQTKIEIGEWVGYRNGEKFRKISDNEYEVSVSAKGPLTLNRANAPKRAQAHIKAYEIRKSELENALRIKNPLNMVTPSDKEFDQWITDWYVENFFRHPEIPMELVNHLIHDPVIRIEYIDAVTFKEELKNREAFMGALSKLYTPAESDNLQESRRIIAEIARAFPNEVLEHTRLALALSLIHDASISYNSKRLIALGFLPPQKGWLRSHMEVFQWKTNPINIREFIFKNEDLTIRQQTWANRTTQSPESLEWSWKEPFSEDLDAMYMLTPWRTKTFKKDIRKTSYGCICRGQAHVLLERLIARNVPSSYNGGGFNNSKELPHAYVWGLTPQGFKNGGAWSRSNGFTIEPTNNAHITDGMFIIQVGEEYNTPLRQKLRVKTQYASTLGVNRQNEVIEDILLENPEFAPAHILRMKTGGEIPNKDFENPLDRTLFHQALVWKYTEDGNLEKAIESFHKMVEGQDDPVLRIGWGIQTWSNIENIDMKFALTPEFGKISPHYPGTIGYVIMTNLTNLTSDYLESENQFREARRHLIRNAQRENPDFKEIMDHYTVTPRR